MDEPSSSSSTFLSRSPAIDRHNPIIRDSRRSIIPPPTTHPPPRVPTKPNYHKNHPNKKSNTINNIINNQKNAKKKTGSTRYLLSEHVVLSNNLSDFDPARKIFPPDNLKPEPVKSTPSVDQVVVLRVSLHCRGCERKMRKHISRMEGVTSFNIDFATKKVTVMGYITPLEVLSSISKVKNTQLLTPTLSSSSTSTSPVPKSSSNSEFKSHGASI